MRFGTRNAYYLRLSATVVIPLYLYLDEQHVEWMSERVLQHVLSDLRPLIPTKLLAESDAHLGPGGSANAKKGTVDVHRGDTYQFAYFLRKTDPHAVLIKTRNFIAAPKGAKIEPPPQPSEEVSTSKRKKAVPKKARPVTKSSEKRGARGKGKGNARADDDEEDVEEPIVITSSDEDGDVQIQDTQPALAAPRRSARRRKIVAGGYREEGDNDVFEGSDVEMLVAERPQPAEVPGINLDNGDLITMDETEPIEPATVKVEEAELALANPPTNNASDDQGPSIATAPLPDTIEAQLAAEEEEPKPKPLLQLQYKGCNLDGRCLCVIVEPYPPIRSQRQVSLAPTGLVAPRAASIAPADSIPSGAAQRARTPLFLPEFDRERSVTPALIPQEQRTRPPVPLFDEEAEDEDEGGMFEFSQILHSVGGYAAGTAEDEDEMDGSALFGDADEAREL